MEWRDIETAPKDGTRVLLWLPDVDRGLPGVEAAQWWGDCWWTNGGPNAGADMAEWSNATHWMPLPAPPGSDPGIPVYKLEDGTDEFVKKNK